jgi:two-component system chemotaxis response regulator CheB
MIRVLIVDDSAVVRELLTFILSSDPELDVVRAVTNGREALQAVQELRPDIVTMDIHMPEMDGFDATRQIMETAPTPIVIVSGSVDTSELEKTFRALEAGALMVVGRPPGPGYPGFEQATSQLILAVKAMAEVKVVKRWPRERLATAALRPPVSPRLQAVRRRIRIVAVGASTGGPVALQVLIDSLPKDFSIPVLMVQHMAPGFIHGFAEWLSQATERPVLVPTNGTTLFPGHYYVAPDAHHMEFDQSGRIVLVRKQPQDGLCPSVARLFRSAADVYGANAAGILLTGMGKDGAAELKILKERGALTFAQDEESSLIHGMPGEAIRLGAVDHVLPIERIAATLASVVN